MPVVSSSAFLKAVQRFELRINFVSCAPHIILSKLSKFWQVSNTLSKIIRLMEVVIDSLVIINQTAFCIFQKNSLIFLTQRFSCWFFLNISHNFFKFFLNILPPGSKGGRLIFTLEFYLNRFTNHIKTMRTWFHLAG